MKKINISSLAYTLGEIKQSHSEAGNFKTVLEQTGIPDMPELWGWGSFYKTAEPYELAYKSAARTLAQAFTKGSDIDLVIFCAAFFPENRLDQHKETGRILQKMEIENANLIGLTLTGCTSVLTAIKYARESVSAGIYRNVLVMAVDALPADEARFTEYCLLSDASVSFIISEGEGVGNDSFEVLGTALKTSTEKILNSSSWNDKALSLSTLEQVLEMSDLHIDQIDHLFSNNVFLPIKKIKEKNLGFAETQLYKENVSLSGHCFSCDSLINLMTFSAASGVEKDQLFVLHADAYGHSASVILKTNN